MGKTKICYSCNRKARSFPDGFTIFSNYEHQPVAYFCSEKCLREKLPFAKILEAEN